MGLFLSICHLLEIKSPRTLGNSHLSVCYPHEPNPMFYLPFVRHFPLQMPNIPRATSGHSDHQDQVGFCFWKCLHTLSYIKFDLHLILWLITVYTNHQQDSAAKILKGSSLGIHSNITIVILLQATVISYLHCWHLCSHVSLVNSSHNHVTVFQTSASFHQRPWNSYLTGFLSLLITSAPHTGFTAFF